MKLTGKCKDEFEKQAIQSGRFKMILGVFSLKLDSYWVAFWKLPPSMQFGVLQDYFDSVGVDITIESWIQCTKYAFSIGINKKHNYRSFVAHKATFETRPEARTASIEKADEIRNQQLEQ